VTSAAFVNFVRVFAPPLTALLLSASSSTGQTPQTLPVNGTVLDSRRASRSHRISATLMSRCGVPRQRCQRGVRLRCAFRHAQMTRCRLPLPTGLAGTSSPDRNLSCGRARATCSVGSHTLAQTAAKKYVDGFASRTPESWRASLARFSPVPPQPAAPGSCGLVSRSPADVSSAGRT
jgi:hypothetical protein